ncbi:MAG: rod shape-determining protein [Cyanobacteria bacterium P01_F01_bin.42]
MGIFSRLSKDIAIDLGSVNTLAYVVNQGIVLNEPSVVAVDKATQQALAVGEEAKQMLGKIPGNVAVINPRQDGVIADCDNAELMLKQFLQRVHGGQNLIAPRLVVGTPTGATGVERRSIQETALQSGAREVFLIDDPLAAAIGAGLPVSSPTGSMVVDIGGGTTEAAVTSLYGTVLADSERVAGDTLTESIMAHLKSLHQLEVSDRTAEQLKLKIGSAFPHQDWNDATMEVRGLHALSGLPRTVMIRGVEVRESIMEPLTVILDVIKRTLERVPAELTSDVFERGIMLTGGTALLPGLDDLISQDTGLVVHKADAPLECSAQGMGMVLENFKELSRVFNRNSESY